MSPIVSATFHFFHFFAGFFKKKKFFRKKVFFCLSSFLSVCVHNGVTSIFFRKWRKGKKCQKGKSWARVDHLAHKNRKREKVLFWEKNEKIRFLGERGLLAEKLWNSWKGEFHQKIYRYTAKLEYFGGTFLWSFETCFSSYKSLESPNITRITCWFIGQNFRPFLALDFAWRHFSFDLAKMIFGRASAKMRPYSSKMTF